MKHLISMVSIAVMVGIGFIQITPTPSNTLTNNSTKGEANTDSEETEPPHRRLLAHSETNLVSRISNDELPEVKAVSQPEVLPTNQLTQRWKRDALASAKKVWREYRPLIQREARRTGFSPEFITAVIAVESSGNPNAHSYANAAGLMQITPIVLKDLDIKKANLWDPAENVRIGSRYFQLLRDHYGHHTTPQLLIAYHAGPETPNRMNAHEIENYPYAQKVAYVANNI